MLKEGIKGIIDTFLEIPMPSKTNKLIRMKQKLSEDVKIMKMDHETRIG